MVGISFARPIGPYADSKELEYVSSLHQTGKNEIRQDGTINAKDVMHFLCSRHGIRVEQEVVQRAIIQELAGTRPVPEKQEQAPQLGLASGDEDAPQKEPEDDSDEEEEELPGMDLCQVLALLLIPFLRSGNSDGTWHQQESVGLTVQLALDTIWAELRNRAPELAPDLHKQEEGVLITPDILRLIMDSVGEFNLPEETLQEMLVAASGNTNKAEFYLTKASFLQTLTADTQLWDINNDQSKTTHFGDARKASGNTETSIPEKENNNALDFNRVYTASNIDNTADTFRSTSWFVFVWTSAVWIYVAYVNKGSQKVESFQGCKNKFGCDIAQALVNWIVIGFELMFYGFIWVMVANLGNSTAPITSLCDKLRTTHRLLWGIAVVVVFTILAFVYEYRVSFASDQEGIYNTTKIREWEGAYVIVLIMGCVILLHQLVRLANLYLPMGPFATADQEFKEQRTKEAAAAKTLKMVEHATLLHICPDDDGTFAGPSLTETTVSEGVTNNARMLHLSTKLSNRSSALGASSKKSTSTGASTSTVLLNYSHFQDYEEESGGVFWTWRKLWDGSLFREEGIYLHGRLLAINFVQFLICFFLIGYVVVMLRYVEEFMEPQDDGCSFRINGILVQSDSTFVDQLQDLLAGNYSELLESNHSLSQLSSFLGHNLTELFSDYADEGDEVSSWDMSNFSSSDMFATNYTLEGGIETLSNLTEATNYTLEDGIKTLSNLTEKGQEFWSQGQELWNSTGELWSQGQELWNSTDHLTEALWNATGDLLENLKQNLVFNLNDTHFADILGNIYLGQFPVWNGTAFSNGAVTVCWEFYETNGTNYWFNNVTFANSVKEALGIKHWEYTLAFAIGLITAIGSALTISCVFIPTFVSWVLKYRSGFAPSLKGNAETYLLYRSSPDKTAVLWGSAFWGILFSSAIVFAVFATITFLLAWEVTRDFIWTFLSQLIGIICVTILKMIIIGLLRSSFYAGGYYRKRPGAANIMNVVIESLNLGLSIGNVIARMGKLFVISCFFIGRIDTPMLAPGANTVAGTDLDPTPQAFQKDLLIHEAHRHPFIERLGLLYLLKLFNGKEFGSRAGSYWRILFVLALFPWMRNYRVDPERVSLLKELAEEVEEDEEDKNDESKHDARSLISGVVVGEVPLEATASDSLETLESKRSALESKRSALRKQLEDLNQLFAEKEVAVDNLAEF